MAGRQNGFLSGAFVGVDVRDCTGKPPQRWVDNSPSKVCRSGNSIPLKGTAIPKPERTGICSCVETRFFVRVYDILMVRAENWPLVKKRGAAGRQPAHRFGQSGARCQSGGGRSQSFGTKYVVITEISADYGDEATMHGLAARLNKAGEALAEAWKLCTTTTTVSLRHVNASVPTTFAGGNRPAVRQL